MREESSRTHDVFLSYSSKDKTWADAACAVLERHRVRCWIAPRDITPGDEWGAAIIKGLNGSRIMVLIFSGHANASEQVRREVERAISQGMTILPVRIEDIRPEGAMEYALSNRHWLDAFTPPVERQLELLARSVKKLLGNGVESGLAPAPADVAPPRRTPWKKWSIALTSSLFGLMALAVIFITIRDKNRRETQRSVRNNSAVVVKRASPEPAMMVDEGLVDKTAVKTADLPKPQPTVTDEPQNLITNSIEMKLVLIPAGEFLMGSPDPDQDAFPPEKPQHRVRIPRPFYLGVTEVTRGQYQGVTGENPSFFKGSDDLPVEQVSWNDAIAFCNNLSEREGLKPYYRSDGGVQSGGDGYRLPTEAEWEYSCRAGTSTRYSFGDDEAGLGEYAWFKGNSSGKTHPVGQKPPNRFGLYDMHGNVEEWCWDGYDKDCYRQSPVVDATSPLHASYRVNRGGGCDSVPHRSRAALRDRNTPDTRGNDVGFRLARDQSGS